MSSVVKVLLVVPRDGVFRSITVGFSAIAGARGWLTELAYRSHETMRTRPDLRRTVRLVNPDVLVLALSTYRLLSKRDLAGRIVVAADADLTAHGIPSVVVDNKAVGRVAAEYFLKRGFRSFGTYGLGRWRFAEDRAGSFRQAVEAAGCGFTGWGRNGTTLPLSSYHWMHFVDRWVTSVPKPAGILSCCDHWSEQLISHCRLAGLRIPEDLAIVGVDNDEFICGLTMPPLSSVMIPWQRLGNELALLVDRLLEGQAPPGGPIVVSPGAVVTRQSSDTMAVKDLDVAAALAFIRSNPDRPIGVPEVVRHAAIYRQKLERKFREHLGRTIMQEVRHVHVEQAKRLLATTDMDMPEIAERSGFANASKLSILFRKLTGTTPSRYRRQYHAAEK